MIPVGQNWRISANPLISRHPDPWRKATAHPFLNGIQDGTLSDRAFRAWLEQDYLFAADLLAFQARLLAVASRPAQATLASGLVALEAELTWFEEHAEGLGVTLAASRHATTEAYRAALSQMLSAGEQPALTALWALERAYLEAWQGAAPGAERYRAFVEHWTVPEFVDYVSGLETLSIDDPRSETAFLEVCDLERAFWDMAWNA